ncbi:DEAD/DEAH box helicase [Pseudomonas sp. NW5]|uniref:DEAD/DEAH box helicase n=1 Tax=Pseudomonas sp. NW5 TaxID=2934934 RepID=UPI002021A727|nr:DEAD/DEAH box helicase [Pseudomonas sp. NW5]MCL7463238.1 DEAD/DEAH box helicase [Pseudomonas sp. NW5]
MTDPALLPRAFTELAKNLPSGMVVSDRVLDAEMLIDRIDGRITASLAGVRTIRGVRHLLKAPSPAHNWVLDAGTVRPLPIDAPTAFLSMLDGGRVDDLSYSQAVGLLRRGDGELSISATERFHAAGRISAEALPGTLEVPGLNASLFPYQARGVQWMQATIARTSGLILADEMGLGKTLQIIALLLIDPPPPSSPALIICPASLIANWSRELERFALSLTLSVHLGPRRTGIYRGLQQTNIVITTYDTMVNDIAILSALEWSWLICDEAQAIKNPDSNRRQAIVSIPRRRTIPMTGTPVENTLMDLWSLMDFAIPGILGDRKAFERDYPDSLEAAKALSSVTDPVILKRRVADVAADLPERIDVDLPLGMDDLLAEHYCTVREETLARYPVAGALVATLQLQLVCAHPWLRSPSPYDEDGEFAEVDRGSGLPLMTPKMERTISLLREAFSNGTKVIVFALFNRIGDLIREAGVELPPAYWGAINGSTAQADRQRIIDEFSSHEGPGCLVLNPKAAGAGLNITAATLVIHYTPVWNPALEAQASARAHRRGQTMPVTVCRLYFEDTVERVMLDRSVWKQALGNEIIPLSHRDEQDLKRALTIEPRKP